jgi:hypothetical protein
LIALAVAIGLIALVLVLVYTFRDELRHHETTSTSASTATAVAAEPPRRAPDAPPLDDLIEPGEPLWTALDDHQLNRLLRESSS